MRSSSVCVWGGVFHVSGWIVAVFFLAKLKCVDIKKIKNWKDQIILTLKT